MGEISFHFGNGQTMLKSICPIVPQSLNKWLNSMTKFLTQICFLLKQIDESFWCPSEAILTTGLVVNKKPEGPVPYVYENSGGLIHEADHVYELIRNGKHLESA